MLNEREYIHRFNAAEPGELAAMLLSPTEEEVRILRTYLGNETYARMRQQALTATTTRAEKKGNVVVIHGIMGGELTSNTIATSELAKLWLNYLQLVLGRFNRFRLDEAGTTEVDKKVSIAATAMLKKFYGELVLVLARDWNVCEFWFDWRKDIRAAASQLAARAAAKFGADAPFDIVAHSMGGLVARWYISQNRKKWDGNKSRLIMLGTPNYGSFAVPQIMTGLEGIVRKIAAIDTKNNRRQISDIANTFPGSYQMMPTHTKFADFYRAETWARWASVSQAHLDTALAFQKVLDPIWDDRMVYIAGYGQETIHNVKSLDDLGTDAAYEKNEDGDGRVPHTLGWKAGTKVWYVREAHGSLPTNALVQAAVRDILAGADPHLDKEPQRSRSLAPPPSEEVIIAGEEAELRIIASQTYEGRGTTRSALQAEEQAARAEELILRGWVDANAPVRTGAATGETTIETTPDERPKIKIAVVHESITKFVDADAIAVGVYIGVRPDSATKYLDNVITNAYAGRPLDTDVKAEERLITQLLERGIIHGGLGQPFFVPDPRDKSLRRLVAVVGMGTPGRFGTPECTVLSRELCWSLGKLKRGHIATVLIGSGAGNLETKDAILAWLRGIYRALLGTPAAEQIQKLTFVEFRASRVLDIDHAIREVMKPQSGLEGQAEASQLVNLSVEYEEFDAKKMRDLRGAVRKEAKEEAERYLRAVEERLKEQTPFDNDKNDIPARLTISYDEGRSAFRFGAITSSAAVPEREVALDPKLVDEAAAEIAALTRTSEQQLSGNFLQKLLVPRDFREQLSGREPLVLLVDSKTARIPWEMMSYPQGEDSDPGRRQRAYSSNAFLGTARGLTRQLRTTFAPPPEPPPPTHRKLNVLIVANPAADALLPGAEKEGVRLKEIFDSFNEQEKARVPDETRRNEVVVKTMLGPFEAKRFAVLKELMSRDYDVLHFAGHCRFVKDNPAKSGWIFSNDDVLSANELNRIDRVPRFVFSNACESGITSGDPLAIAPSFAEAFFLRGVANFVCTAWPINDQAALDFARVLYENLLGVGSVTQPQKMHVAMCAARSAIAASTFGAGTWGAYQHYGNPYYRFFDEDAAASVAPAARTPAARRPYKSGAGGRSSGRGLPASPATAKASRKRGGSRKAR